MTEDGGNAIDPETGEDLLWGQLKPNNPKTTPDGKVRKYEAPPYEPTQAICPKSVSSYWLKSCQKSRTFKEISRKNPLPMGRNRRDNLQRILAPKRSIILEMGEGQSRNNHRSSRRNEKSRSVTISRNSSHQYPRNMEWQSQRR
ncbi:DNA primase [Crocosphaera watsonii WH 0402]|uniref:DNA primase n=1 Tax=Crocosphaera watsonii WH 0402 TaxID=1284629 RepID=T2JVR7_CROWT|nr:DNA primase [Crocosphaera watsonii WH 0402]